MVEWLSLRIQMCFCCLFQLFPFKEIKKESEQEQIDSKHKEHRLKMKTSIVISKGR